MDWRIESTIDAPFVFTVNYSPPIAQLSVKGRDQVLSEKEETSRMIEEHKLNRPRPVTIIQAVSSIAMAKTILLSKSLGIPPPLPPTEVPQEQMQGQQQQGQRRSGPRYATRADPNPYDHPKFWRSVIPPKNWIGSPIS